ncbi:hypothetical protein GCK32_010481, partial [Trichostrongylus colubriformis]
VPGFDVENTNQKARRDSQQEQINRSVLSKTLRILSLPNADKNGVNAVLDNFPKNVVKYFQKYKSTELAVLLGWQYDDWHGTPIKKLLTSSELENMEVTFNICILVKKGMYQLKGISG